MNLGKKRGFLQISFAWLFGIIAGAIILALAIFMVSKITHTGQYQTSAEVQKQISVLLNPLESGVQSGQVTTLDIASPTRIYNVCNNQSGIFGEQSLSVSQQSFGKWSTQSQGISVPDRYIFSDNVTEGKEFLLFSKPFDFPFKVADLIYLTSASVKYCFTNTPAAIDTELSNLKQSNIVLENDPSLCPAGTVEVCFTNANGGGCSNEKVNVTVSYQSNTVTKDGNTVVFSGDALMYAAIFSDKQIYDCQLQRLMGRENELAKIYQGKVSLIQSAGCNIGFSSDLSALEKSSGGYRSESDLASIIQTVSKLQQDNEFSSCQLW